MDEDFTIWKRLILIAIGVIIVGGILGILYVWYEIHSLNTTAAGSSATDQTLTSAQQEQNNLKSLTSPTPAPATTASSTTSSNANAPVPPPPASLTAPAPKKTSPAEQQQEESNINALTAPSH